MTYLKNKNNEIRRSFKNTEKALNFISNLSGVSIMEIRKVGSSVSKKVTGFLDYNNTIYSFVVKKSFDYMFNLKTFLVITEMESL